MADSIHFNLTGVDNLIKRVETLSEKVKESPQENVKVLELNFSKG